MWQSTWRLLRGLMQDTIPPTGDGGGGWRIRVSLVGGSWLHYWLTEQMLEGGFRLVNGNLEDLVTEVWMNQHTADGWDKWWRSTGTISGGCFYCIVLSIFLNLLSMLYFFCICFVLFNDVKIERLKLKKGVWKFHIPCSRKKMVRMREKCKMRVISKPGNR
jgi:hypothetical protein